MNRLKTDAEQKRARLIWMITGILSRSLMLMGLGWLLSQKGKSVFSIAGKGFDLASLVMLAGGLFLIYKSVKDFLEAFTGNKRKFDKPVLANLDGPDIWRVGFITQESAANFGMADYAVVYIPLSYALTGVTYFVPKEKIKILQDVSSAEAMKFAVSGGVSEVE